MDEETLEQETWETENPSPESGAPGEARQNGLDGGDGGREGAVGPQTEEGVDAPDAAGAGEGTGEEPPGGAGRERQREQTREDNAAARAARLRAEAETEARMKKQYDERVAGMGIPNPYTGKPFRSFQEFLEYGERFSQQKLEQEARRQGRPVEELQEERENQSFLARLRQQEKDQREAAKAAGERRDFLVKDLEDFTRRFPDVDPAKLEQNPKFRKFAGKRLYREALGDLYGDFVELVSDTERAAVAKAEGKRVRGTGSGQGGGGVTLTPEQAASLEEWNRENPELRMTAKEFLGR